MPDQESVRIQLETHRIRLDTLEGLMRERLTRVEFEARFEPVRNVVFGMVGLVMLSVGSALMVLLMKAK